MYTYVENNFEDHVEEIEELGDWSWPIGSTTGFRDRRYELIDVAATGMTFYKLNLFN